MEKFYYATMDENNAARVLSLCNKNLVPIIKDFNFIIVHPCATYKEAVATVEAWKNDNN